MRISGMFLIAIILIFHLVSGVYAVPEGSIQCKLTSDNASFFPGEEISIKFTVKNISNKPVTLLLSDKYFENFEFGVITIKNKTVTARDAYLLMKKEAQLQGIGLGNVTTIILSSGDEYSRIINISDIFLLENPDTYFITGIFYPVPRFSHPVAGIDSTTFKIKVREGEMVESNQRMIAELEKTEIEKPKNPQETIDFMLTARLNYNWPNYFRFIDLDLLIQNFQDYYQEYLKIPRSQRDYVINKFKEYLKDYLKEDLVSWDIYRTVVESDYAVVYAMVTYEFLDNYELRKVQFKRNYSFKLYKKNGQWYLYSYIVKAQQ